MPKKNKGGRPRLAEWPENKTVALGEELLGWLRRKENADVVHLSEFYSGLKDISRSQWHTLRQRPEFLHYYEMALEMVGCLIIRNKDIPTAYGSRFLAIYFKDLREHEREIKREEIEMTAKVKLDAETARSIPPNDEINEKERIYTDKIGALLDENQRLREQLGVPIEQNMA